jgi:TetR/AcrR family transcriptional regulator, mexCD-oprJ operon repressor
MRADSGPASGRRADARRNEQLIADAALRVLAERPGASMSEIAAASGLGRATLYRHFSSRDELVHAIQGQAAEAGARALAAADLDEGRPVRALARAIRALIGVGDRYRLLAREAALDSEVLQRQAQVAEPLLKLVRRGQAEGELRDDLPPEWILPALASLLVLALRELGSGEVEVDEVARRVIATFLGGLAVNDDF